MISKVSGVIHSLDFLRLEGSGVIVESICAALKHLNGYNNKDDRLIRKMISVVNSKKLPNVMILDENHQKAFISAGQA